MIIFNNIFAGPGAQKHGLEGGIRRATPAKPTSRPYSACARVRAAWRAAFRPAARRCRRSTSATERPRAARASPRGLPAGGRTQRGGGRWRALVGGQMEVHPRQTRRVGRHARLTTAVRPAPSRPLLAATTSRRASQPSTEAERRHLQQRLPHAPRLVRPRGRRCLRTRAATAAAAAAAAVR